MAIRAAELMVHIGADTRDGEKGIESFNSKLTDMGRTATMTGGMLTLGVTTPLAALGGLALHTAADYETAMNVLQAVTKASSAEMALMDAKAKELGADLTLPETSATDAGLAMLELSKAGLSVNDTMAAAKGVLQLAAAGNLSNARAAEIAANALNAFHLAGSEATRVANLLAAAANASSSDVNDLALGVQMAGSVFATSSQKVETLTAALGLMSNAGIKGSDAGTSLKTMVLSLTAPSKAAAGVLKGLGINVYDAAGNMRDMRDIIGQFSTATANLTEQQRNQALATVFGSDAIRAANVVLTGGVEAWDSMMEAVQREGAAAEMAAARMKGLNGAIKAFKSAGENLMLEVATPLLGMLTGLTTKVAEFLPVLTQMDPNLRNAGLAFLVVLAAAGPVLTVLGALAAAIAFVASPIGLVVVGVSLLAAAVAGGVVSLRDIEKAFGFLKAPIEIVRSTLMGMVDVFTGYVLPAFAAFKAGNMPEAFALLGSAANIAGGLVQLAFGQMFDWIGAMVPKLIELMFTWGAQFVAWVGPMVPRLLGALGEMLGNLVGWALEAVPSIVGTLANWAMSFIQWVAPMVPKLLDKMLGMLGALLGWLVANAPKILETVLSEWVPAAIGWVAKAAVELLSVLPELIGTLIKWVFTEGIPKTIELFLKLGGAIIEGTLKGIQNAAGQIIGALMDLAGRALQAAKDALGIHSPSREFQAIGLMMGMGLAKGINDSQGLVEAATAGLMGSQVGLGLSLAGAQGPEVLPLSSGSAAAAPMVVNVHVAGSVTAANDLAEEVRRALLRTGRRNLGVGLA